MRMTQVVRMEGAEGGAHLVFEGQVMGAGSLGTKEEFQEILEN